MFKGKPPFDLIQLSKLPEDQWMGRAVFHPGEQVGDVPVWEFDIETDPPSEVELLSEAQNPILSRPPLAERGTSYDVGVVVSWGPDEHFHDIVRVCFVMSSGSSLRYGSYNLWTPILREASKIEKQFGNEQKKILFDIFVIALEGGIGYWSIASKYQCLKPDPDGSGPGSFEGQCHDIDSFYAVVHELSDDNEEGYSMDVPLRIDARVIERGLSHICSLDSKIKVNTNIRKICHALAGWDKDSVGDVDVEVADCIVQAGLFGEVIYG